MFALKHQLWDFARLIGLRDRLRCPSCGAVGTWKPHGGWLDFEDERGIRRWLCKWCGYYRDASGWRFAVIWKRVWTLLKDVPEAEEVDTKVPQAEHYRHCGGWPWLG